MAVIGILGTPYTKIEQSPFWWNQVTYTRQGFVDAVQALGHDTIIIPVDRPDKAESYVKLVDGILLTGGSDVDPQFYGEEPHPLLEGIQPKRDLFEFAALDAAIKHKKAILGVCRGLQVINVHFGGSLYQDLSLSPASLKHRQSTTDQDVATHSISVKSDSLLSFLPEAFRVNSYHHQIVNRLAPNLREIATSADGVVEAVENREQRILAVQWHPETIWQKSQLDHEIFRTFIEEL